MSGNLVSDEAAAELQLALEQSPSVRALRSQLRAQILLLLVRPGSLPLSEVAMAQAEVQAGSDNMRDKLVDSARDILSALGLNGTLDALEAELSGRPLPAVGSPAKAELSLSMSSSPTSRHSSAANSPAPGSKSNSKTHTPVAPAAESKMSSPAASRASSRVSSAAVSPMSVSKSRDNGSEKSSPASSPSHRAVSHASQKNFDDILDDILSSDGEEVEEAVESAASSKQGSPVSRGSKAEVAKNTSDSDSDSDGELAFDYQAMMNNANNQGEEDKNAEADAEDSRQNDKDLDESAQNESLDITHDSFADRSASFEASHDGNLPRHLTASDSFVEESQDNVQQNIEPEAYSPAKSESKDKDDEYESDSESDVTVDEPVEEIEESYEESDGQEEDRKDANDNDTSTRGRGSPLRNDDKSFESTHSDAQSEEAGKSDADSPVGKSSTPAEYRNLLHSARRDRANNGRSVVVQGRDDSSGSAPAGKASVSRLQGGSVTRSSKGWDLKEEDYEFDGDLGEDVIEIKGNYGNDNADEVRLDKHESSHEESYNSEFTEEAENDRSQDSDASPVQTLGNGRNNNSSRGAAPQTKSLFGNTDSKKTNSNNNSKSNFFNSKKDQNDSNSNDDDYGDDFEEVEEEEEEEDAISIGDQGSDSDKNPYHSDEEEEERGPKRGMSRTTSGSIATVNSSGWGASRTANNSQQFTRSSAPKEEEAELESLEEEEDISNVSEDVNQLEISTGPQDNNGSDDDMYTFDAKPNANRGSSSNRPTSASVFGKRGGHNVTSLSQSDEFSVSEAEMSQTFDQDQFDYTTNALPGSRSRKGGW